MKAVWAGALVAKSFSVALSSCSPSSIPSSGLVTHSPSGTSGREECEKQLGSLQDENASPPVSAGPGDGERGTRLLPSVLPEETVGCYRLWRRPVCGQLRLQGQLWLGSWKPGWRVAWRGPRAAQSGWHPPAEPRVAGLLAALPAAGCAQAPCPVCRHLQERSVPAPSIWCLIICGL